MLVDGKVYLFCLVLVEIIVGCFVEFVGGFVNGLDLYLF